MGVRGRGGGEEREERGGERREGGERRNGSVFTAYTSTVSMELYKDHFAFHYYAITAILALSPNFSEPLMTPW